MDDIRVVLDLLGERYSLFEVVDVATQMLDEEMSSGECMDCKVNTFGWGEYSKDEYYMIHDALWQSVVPNSEGMLCFDCLEKRLGRELTIQDFTGAPVNYWIKDADRFSVDNVPPVV